MPRSMCNSRASVSRLPSADTSRAVTSRSGITNNGASANAPTSSAASSREDSPSYTESWTPSSLTSHSSSFASVQPGSVGGQLRPHAAEASLREEEGNPDHIGVIIEEGDEGGGGKGAQPQRSFSFISNRSARSKASSRASGAEDLAMSSFTRTHSRIGSMSFSKLKGRSQSFSSKGGKRRKSDSGEEEEGEDERGEGGEEGKEGEEENVEDDLTYLSVACGYSHTMFITENKLMMTCGNHRNGQLGIDEKKEEIKTLACDRCFTVQAKYCCAQCPRPHGVDRDLSLCEVCCQSIHKQKINKLHGYKEIPAPENKKCKVTPKTVKTWVQVEMQRAEYEDEELEDDERKMPKRKVMLADLGPVHAVSCGDAHTMAIVDVQEDGEGVVYSWGCGGSGRTGFCRAAGEDGYEDEDEGKSGEPLLWAATDPQDVFIATRVHDAWQAHQTRPAKTNEDGEEGELDEELVDREHFESCSLRAAHVACGGQHTLVLKSDGRLLSCGNNEHGQLGRDLEYWEERGSHLFRPVSISQEYSVTSICCGDLHCLIIAGHGTNVFTWGCGLNGRLGLGDTADRREPVSIPGLGSLHKGGRNVAKASCGGAHTAVICNDGTVYVWGSNSCGQCGPFEPPSLEDVNDVEANRAPDVLVPTEVTFPVVKSRRGKKPASEVAKSYRGRASKSFGVSTPRREGRSGSASPTKTRDFASLSSFHVSNNGGDTHRSKTDSDKGPMQRKSGTFRRSGLFARKSQENSQRHHTDRGSVVHSKGGGDSQYSGDGVSNFLQVQCGDKHTLVLRGSEGLWQLGSGLDRKYRLQNSHVKKGCGKKIKDAVQLESCFFPRQVITCFSDSAEVSTIDMNEEGFIFDQVYCTRKVLSIPDADDSEAPPTVEEHFTLTFAFVGDLEVQPGDEVAFTGPSAPEGLRLQSVEEGPWFTVLGGVTDSKWDQQMGPGMSPKSNDNDRNVKWTALPNRITVEVDPNTVSSNDVTFEGLCAVAKSLTDAVRTDSMRNMLVCLRDELPPLKFIASGAYHALLLSLENKVFVWGMGQLGRLGLGNELDQAVPVAYESQCVDIGEVDLRPCETAHGLEIVLEVQGDAPKNPNLEVFQDGDVLMAIDGVRLLEAEDDEVDQEVVEKAIKLLKGPECSTAMLQFARNVQREGFEDTWCEFVEFVPRGVDEDE